MILIALTGGSPANTSTVINQIIKENPDITSHWRLTPEIKPGDNILFLNDLMKPSHHASRIQVYSGIKTVEEGEWFQQYNGFVFHVKGSFSDIPMSRKNHFFVSPGEELKAPWLTVQEALSECVRIQDEFRANEVKR